MNQSIKRWEIKARISQEADAALDQFTPAMRQILYNRGIANAEDAKRFLDAQEPDNTDPFQLSDMEKAVDRLQAAIENGESIAIYGDYDADGVTASALMMQAFSAMDAQVQAYIPNRFDEGYGLNVEALDELKDRGVQVVVTVDCGIRALNEALHARAIGLDLIITDHHNPGADLPEAFAVINPKKAGDGYPSKNLAGVGVAYKLATALSTRIGHADFDPESLLDFVALGTVADLVPLEGENRYLVRAGLQRLRYPQRQGLYSLMQLAGVTPTQMNASHIGFNLGPRLNAAGRLDSAMAAFELLTTNDVMTAGKLAQDLDNQNRERQKITRDMQERAEETAISDGEIPYLLFAAHESFNPGVVGLAASRLTERYYRPSIVGHHDIETTRASCRSIPEFDITAALDKCADLLVKYGGHAAAAGFTVSNDRLDEFLERMNAIAAEQLVGKDLRPVIFADAEVPMRVLTMDFLNQLERLQPTGYGNPEPVFITRGLRVENSRPVGRDGSHLKLSLSEGAMTLDAIAFRQGDWHASLPERIDVIYHFEKNEFRGSVSPQLNIRDIRPAE